MFVGLAMGISSLNQELNVNDGRTVLKHESELFPGKPWFYTAQIKLRIVE